MKITEGNFLRFFISETFRISLDKSINICYNYYEQILSKENYYE
jgi:hypothetical protein